MNKSFEILESVISGRRTIKPDQYTGEEIEEAQVKKILEAANWAPTHGYTEPWRFKVFSGDGRTSLGAFIAQLDQPDPEAESFNAMRYDRLRNTPLKASHVIGIGMKRGENPKIPQIEEICAVAMAVQNMWLTAHALGLAAYWSTGALAFREEMRDFFGLSEGDLSLGLFYIGKPAAGNPVGRRLSSIDEKVSWVRD